MAKKKFIGDPHLKKYSNTSIDYTRKITLLDKQIFQLFFDGVSVQRISLSLKKEPQKIFDTIRIVGYKCQSVYCKKVDSSKNTQDKKIFNDFILGKTIPQLLEKYKMNPESLFKSLRGVSNLYFQYFSNNPKIR
jgi:hypothetical protein